MSNKIKLRNFILMTILLVFFATLVYMLIDYNEYITVVSVADIHDVEKITSILEVNSIKYKIKDGTEGYLTINIKRSKINKFNIVMGENAVSTE